MDNKYDTNVRTAERPAPAGTPSARPGTPAPAEDDRPPLTSPRAARVGTMAAVCVLLVGFIVGLLFFLRPAVSEKEKRELTAFPTLTWDSLVSGEWTSQVSLWYADTFPGRDTWTSAWHGVQSLFGVGGERAEIGSGEDVPETMGDPADTDLPDGPSEGGEGGEQINGYYLSGDTAYELYYFNKNGAIRYAGLINKAAEKLAGKAKVYDAVIPLSYSFGISKTLQTDTLRVADGGQVMNYVYSGLKNVTTVDSYSALMAHKDEYIFFRTDHHWTATGAYYVYAAFAARAGFVPTPLSSYEKLSFEGFLGTLYAKTGEPSALRNHPDTVEAYVPHGTNEMTVLQADGTETRAFPIIQRRTDAFYQNAASKYNCFIAGDNPLTTIHNPAVAAGRRGTSVLLIKESFGNAFAPFLVDSYEYVYVIDYRYYKGDLAEFVTSHGVGDVLFLNNVVAVTADARLNEMSRLIGD